MSKSYHVTRKDFSKLSKREIDGMEKDPDSLLYSWADKHGAKKDAIRKRKNKKQIKHLE
ncbi:hypothetical protein [Portibacter lacus]|uniref:Uncharacterized protein n=1 Tax=Portibacter lacus TaxID=1099794 RepID=A0AA37SMT0_9BACT|nr:hypothetical protein [Portibacter lacus]GLR16162.1 hypothetical protein GCM10007940_07770 [Portibacter lacus]